MMKKALYTLFMMLFVAGAIDIASAGPIDPVKKCKTCGKPLSLCPGHNSSKQKKERNEKQKKQKEPKKEFKQSQKQVASAGYDVTFSCNVEEAIMYIDGTKYGVPNGSHMLKRGIHAVRLTADGYQDYSQSIAVTNKSKHFEFIMKPLKELGFTVNGVIFRMVLVDSGVFMMGSDDNDDDEKPLHQVSMSDYYIGQTEVTQELWQAVMGYNPSMFIGNLQCPVEQVSWNDCQDFIHRLNSITGEVFRLPHEDEWEYAARGGNRSNGYTYSGGNDLNNVAWYAENSGNMTHPVKMKLPNELGIYDMSGNVWEWCEDRYGKNSYSDPLSQDLSSNRVIRGGSWDFSGYCRVSKRDNWIPTTRLMNLGFRLALKCSRKK